MTYPVVLPSVEGFLEGLPRLALWANGAETIRAVNRRFADLAGIPQEHLRGASLSRALGPGYPRLRPLVRIALGGEEVRFEETLMLGGIPFRFSGHLLPHRIPEDPRVGVLLLLRDLGEVRGTAPGPRSPDAPTLGEMAAPVLSDLRDALTPVLGHGELLWREGDLRARESARAIRQGLLRAGEHLRTLQRVLAECPEAAEPLDLAYFLSDLIRSCFRRLPRGIRLTGEIPSGLPPLMARPARLRRALENLVANAWEALPEEGECRVRASFEPQTWGAGVLRVVVEDTGEGMTPEVRLRAFDPFFTTRREEGHGGLGLAEARAVARDHGGSLRLESVPGEGTRAVMELPAVRRGIDETEPRVRGRHEEEERI